MEGLKEAIEFITNLKEGSMEPKVLDINGNTYCNKNLTRYDKKSIEKGKEVPVKEADHCMDAIRYVVMGAWSKIKHWLPLDIVEDDVNIGDISSREVREEDEYL